jgi:hypothetical protein
VLPSIALADPLTMMSALASDHADQILGWLLRQVNERCARAGSSVTLERDELKLHLLRIKDCPCAVIEMPPPQETTEAYYVAMLLLGDEPAQAKLRYFTLEYSTVYMAEPTTVLAEWTPTEHTNFGPGPAPSLGAFFNAISALLP